jgi:hypothetical protein
MQLVALLVMIMLFDLMKLVEVQLVIRVVVVILLFEPIWASCLTFLPHSTI